MSDIEDAIRKLTGSQRRQLVELHQKAVAAGLRIELLEPKMTTERRPNGDLVVTVEQQYRVLAPEPE